MYDLTWPVFILLASFGPSDLLLIRGSWQAYAGILKDINPFIYLIFGLVALYAALLFIQCYHIFIILSSYCFLLIFLSGDFEVNIIPLSVSFKRVLFWAETVSETPVWKKFILKTASFITIWYHFIILKY